VESRKQGKDKIGYYLENSRETLCQKYWKYGFIS
tara:strand:+ start:446 stop:547 length:102 start_codon:yes stop_codon:yes gene_type:complete